jgi:hypothetical protein
MYLKVSTILLLLFHKIVNNYRYSKCYVLFEKRLKMTTPAEHACLQMHCILFWIPHLSSYSFLGDKIPLLNTQSFFVKHSPLKCLNTNFKTLIFYVMYQLFLR